MLMTMMMAMMINQMLMGMTKLIIVSLFEPEHDKSNKMTCTLSEDSEQPGPLHSPISLFAMRFVGS